MEVYDFYNIAIITSVAFASPILAERLRVPAVVVEIVAGIILGVSFLNLIKNSEWVSFLSALGLIFLMFLSGLEIDFNLLLKKENVFRPLVYLSISFSLVLLITRLLGLDFIYAILLTNVSVGIVMLTLRELKIETSNFGQVGVVTSLLTDFTTMFLLSIYVILLTTEGGILQIALPFGIFTIFILSYYLGRLAIWYFPDFMSKWFEEDPMELGVRGSIAIIIFFVGVSYFLGVEAILGAFLAGTLFSLTFRSGEVLSRKLFGIGYGFLIPIFFIQTGASTKLIFDFSAIYFIILLLLIAYTVKIFPSFVVFGDRIKALSFGILQTSKLSLTIAAVEIGFKLGLISSFEKTNIILFTILTSLLSPTLFKFYTKKYEKLID